MRLLIDTLGAPTTSGGMRLHATEVLRAWSDEHPDDDVVVVGGGWVADLPLSPRFRFVRWPNDNPVIRAVGQQLVVPLVYWSTGRRRLLTTNSVVSPLLTGARTTVVAHDWRHLRHPAEFSRFQRLYRGNWLRSARRASHVVAVSEKTGRETRRLVDPRSVVVVENGRDHAGQWSDADVVRPSAAPDMPFVLTYGQHTNKRPELVVRALADGALPRDLAVVVVGVDDGTAGRLAREASELGLQDRTVLLGYVEEAEYRWLATNAGVIALVSSDEGFGLPLAEAASLGVPAVVASDSGVAELFADSAIPVDPGPRSIAAGLARALSGPTPTRGSSDRTWTQVVDDLRRLVDAPPVRGTNER